MEKKQPTISVKMLRKSEENEHVIRFSPISIPNLFKKIKIIDNIFQNMIKS